MVPPTRCRKILSMALPTRCRKIFIDVSPDPWPEAQFPSMVLPTRWGNKLSMLLSPLGRRGRPQNLIFVALAPFIYVFGTLRAEMLRVRVCLCLFGPLRAEMHRFIDGPTDPLPENFITFKCFSAHLWFIACAPPCGIAHVSPFTGSCHARRKCLQNFRRRFSRQSVKTARAVHSCN